MSAGPRFAGRSYQDRGEVLTYDEPHVLPVGGLQQT